MSKDETIRIPGSVASRVKLLIKGSRYESVEAYVIALIQETIGQPPSFTKREERAVKKRLASLGYE